MYNYVNIPDGIKYKVIKGNKSILDLIEKKHQEKVKKYGTKLDTVILNYQDNYYLVLEQTQEEIVEDIKEKLKSKTRVLKEKLLLDNQEIIRLIETTKGFNYISQFYDDTTRLLLGFEMPDLSLLYNDIRTPLNRIFNIKEQSTLEKKKYINKNEKIDFPNIEDILSLDIVEVLDRIGIEYKKNGNGNYALYDNGKWTDGWRANKLKNIVKDFAGKGRAQGNPFTFVKQYCKLNDRETFIWFKENFNM